MHKLIPSNYKPFAVTFTLEPIRPARVRIVAFDPDAPKSKYTDRIVNLTTKRNFELKFPQSGPTMMVSINSEGGNSVKGYDINFQKLKTCGVWMDAQTRRFVNFAQEFCQRASYLSEGIYKSNNGEFLIRYMNEIRNRGTNMVMNTPARIGHTTGNIEVARNKFMTYTVPQRMVILLHEYSHKYMNHKVGRGIDDEVAADINALYIYLGLGYPHIDARTVFAQVFYGSGSDLNVRRINIIEEYITRFEKGQVVAGCN